MGKKKKVRVEPVKISPEVVVTRPYGDERTVFFDTPREIEGHPSSSVVSHGVAPLVDALRKSESARADLTRRVLEAERRELSVLRGREQPGVSGIDAAQDVALLLRIDQLKLGDHIGRIHWESSRLVGTLENTQADWQWQVSDLQRQLVLALAVTQEALERHQSELPLVYASRRWRLFRWRDRVRHSRNHGAQPDHSN